MKKTIKIEKRTTVEIEVEYPIYCQHGFSVYCITEDQAIEIKNEKEEKHIKVKSPGFSYNDNVILDGRKISELEFNNSYIEVLDHLHRNSPVLPIATEL